MSLYPPVVGETGTVGVIDCRVRHIAGEHWSLCGRWHRLALYVVRPNERHARLPLCQRCDAKRNEASNGSD